jgi:hypothetical protein
MVCELHRRIAAAVRTGTSLDRIEEAIIGPADLEEDEKAACGCTPTRSRSGTSASASLRCFQAERRTGLRQPVPALGLHDVAALGELGQRR